MAKRRINSTYLKEERRRRGLTQAKFAEFLNVPLRTYVGYEDGESGISHKSASKISSALGVDVDKVIVSEDLGADTTGTKGRIISFLKAKRHELNMVQVDFSAFLEIQHSTYKAYEYGISNVPPNVLDQIAEKLETSVAAIVSFNEEYTHKEIVSPSLTAQSYVTALGMIDPWVVFALGAASKDQVDAVRAIVKVGNVAQKERDKVIRGIIKAAGGIENLDTLKQALGFIETAAKADQKAKEKKGTA